MGDSASDNYHSNCCNCTETVCLSGADYCTTNVSNLLAFLNSLTIDEVHNELGDDSTKGWW